MKKAGLLITVLILIISLPGFTTVCEADEGDRIYGIPSIAARIPVFMYHNFTGNEHVVEGKEGLYVSSIVFEEQLKYLRDKGCTSIGFEELRQYIRDGRPVPKKSFMITIDDVYKEQYTIAYPLLRKYGFKATLFINTASVGVGNRYGWEQLREMEDSGYIDVQSHGEYHIPMNGVKKQEAVLNVTRSFEIMDQQLGPRKVRVFCYPSYSCSKKTIAFLDGLVDMQVTRLGKYVDKRSRTDDIYRFRVTNSMDGKTLYSIINL